MCHACFLIIVTMVTHSISEFSCLVKPHQPRNFNYPSRTFGKTKVVRRAFRNDWYSKWKWLHYDKALDAVFCFHWCKAEQEDELLRTYLLYRRVLLIGRMQLKHLKNMKKVNAIRMLTR